MHRALLLSGLLLAYGISSGSAASQWAIEDPMLANYFRAETERLAGRCLGEIKTLEDWQSRQAKYREQLAEMLGLAPWPERTPLKPQLTGRIEREDFIVENLHFQSKPGLYVTANLYLPKQLTGKAPTVLYVCGHGPVITNGISYGNKVAYQHHGIWFARNGYVCLLIDTLQLGEIQGLHHGTHREALWWWNSRGYTPAGVEAWNSIRALDYLETRTEVDSSRIGVTGRSGGGAYSWWLAGLDHRVRAAAPVAGITDLQNHIVDGAVEGHCDCMFTVNTYSWDYPQVAALFAPRPLLIANSDKDSIFPLDGVMRTHQHTRRIYDLHGSKAPNLGILITEGPHKDTQDLQVPVFRFFNRHLKAEDPIIEMAARKLLTPQELKVFSTLPNDAINTNIHATFVPRAQAPEFASANDVKERSARLLPVLKEKVFAGWPQMQAPLELKEAFSVRDGETQFRAYDFHSQPEVRLRLYTLSGPGDATSTRLTILDDSPELSEFSFKNWLQSMEAKWSSVLTEEKHAVGGLADANRETFSATSGTNYVWIAPRGIGLTDWKASPKKQTQIRRRFMLLGQTLESMRVWDIRRAIRACLTSPQIKTSKLIVAGDGKAACNILYASLFEDSVDELELSNLRRSHMEAGAPDYLNVLRFTDIPEVALLAAQRCSLRITDAAPEKWAWLSETAHRVGMQQIQVSALKIEPSGGR